MKDRNTVLKEKEQAEKFKALRKELEAQLEEQLMPEMLTNEAPVQVQSIDLKEKLDDARAKQVVEALLFASAKPMKVAEIKRVLTGFSVEKIEGWIAEIREGFVRDNRSFEILEIAGGYEIATKKEFAPWILKVELQKKARQASQSALETLAILAYKQPLTRAEVEDLRGVDVSGVLNTLMERGFLKIVGKKEIPGRPFLYATTEKFLEHFGLKSIQDLPRIEDIRMVVESAVKKEELLGRTQIVDNPNAQDNQPAQETPTVTEENNDGSQSVTQEN